MNECSYKITEHDCENESGKAIKTYGLVIDTDEGPLTFQSLCTDKQKLLSLCDRINNEKLSEKILNEIFEDFIFQN